MNGRPDVQPDLNCGTNLRSIQTRFMDTMSLSMGFHQRPAWMKHRKAKANRLKQRAEAVDAALEIMRDAESQAASEVDAARRTQLRLRAEIEESLPQLQEDDADATDAEKMVRPEGSDES
ncbi:hypothetical protein EV363DRAFT_469649 [Boletus edulis]|uniref:Uncharacterized protein n=1 Tax=Boletus edulis BED1 TaxID=1328754 RepID=A0AAD4BU52_BOLED|nr:hypothetical protein EV363DRAFT_469649 [Boletus edulis]KAF8439954.1 hypothetical protein L210DRAFT_2192438 [Boletus edulis BED1]